MWSFHNTRRLAPWARGINLNDEGYISIQKLTPSRKSSKAFSVELPFDRIFGLYLSSCCLSNLSHQDLQTSIKLSCCKVCIDSDNVYYSLSGFIFFLFLSSPHEHLSCLGCISGGGLNSRNDGPSDRHWSCQKQLSKQICPGDSF